jgi:hypothetical protein
METVREELSFAAACAAKTQGAHKQAKDHGYGDGWWLGLIWTFRVNASSLRQSIYLLVMSFITHVT